VRIAAFELERMRRHGIRELRLPPRGDRLEVVRRPPLTLLTYAAWAGGSTTPRSSAGLLPDTRLDGHRHGVERRVVPAGRSRRPPTRETAATRRRLRRTAVW
jgi:hypothetical protein